MPPPKPTIPRLAFTYLWPLLLVPIELTASAMLHGGFLAWSDSAAPFSAVFLAMLLSSFVFALNAGAQAWRHAQRLPRRQRSERVLLVPRPIAAALGATVAGFVVFQGVVVAIIFGGCILMMGAVAADAAKHGGEEATPVPAVHEGGDGGHADPAPGS